MQAALQVVGLRKRYGSFVAVDGLDFVVYPGEFYALLGANGAGKTTTLRMVVGLLAPDAGEVFVWGRSITREAPQAKGMMAYLGDEPALYSRLRPLEYLEFVSGLWSVEPEVAAPRARDLLQELGLWEVRNEDIQNLSRGMKQKLALAGAFIHAPRLIILDEPLGGLDALAVRQVKDMLTHYTRTGNTVVLTTHILEVAERLAGRIGIMKAGRLVAEGTLDELRRRAGGTEGTLESVFLEVTRADGTSG